MDFDTHVNISLFQSIYDAGWNSKGFCMDYIIFLDENEISSEVERVILTIINKLAGHLVQNILIITSSDNPKLKESIDQILGRTYFPKFHLWNLKDSKLKRFSLIF